MKRLLLSLTPLFFTLTAFAQDATDSPASDDGGSTAGALAALGCTFIPCVIWVALVIAMAVYVYRDATKRRMDNAMLLTILTVFTGPLGLVIYLLMRPKGDVPPPHSGM